MSDLLLELLSIARARGFLGPGDVAFHVEHARAFEPLLPPNATVLDLGSGGGVPGLVLLHDRPDLRMTLLDASERRTTFLSEAIERGGWGDRATVARGRAEEFGRRAEHRGVFGAVVSRSFGAPSVVAECAAPLLRQEGLLIVSEPPDPVTETADGSRWRAEGLAELGMVLGDHVTVAHATLQVIHQRSACPDRYPRRVGVPTKRPLF